MSTWTHVAGTIRLDHLRLDQTPHIDEINKIVSLVFGNPVDFESAQEEYLSCILPLGSEGSLKYGVYVDPNVSTLACVVVYVYGDLRDYDTSDEVFTWFENRITAFIEHQLFLRQAVITVSVDNQDPQMRQYYYDPNEED